MPSMLATGYGLTGILAVSPLPYQTTAPGYYQLNQAVLMPGIPPFVQNEIYILSNGPHTPDIPVQFQLMVVAPGLITIHVRAM